MTLPKLSLGRLVGGFLTLALLVPLPALAFSFLGSWQITLDQSKKNVPPVPVITQTPNRLTIGMGTFSNTGTARSNVKAINTFNIAPGGETLNFGEGFVTLIQDAQVVVKVTIKKLTKGGTKGIHIQKVKFVSNKGQPVTALSARLIPLQLNAGDYKVKIEVRYKKKKNGLWDNSPPPPGSPHTFTFNT